MITASKIKSARLMAGLTQVQAAALVHAGDRAWRKWESGENQMPMVYWELFLCKTAKLPHIASKTLDK